MRGKRRGRERFQVTVSGDNVRSREKGGRGLQEDRESNKVMVRYRERGDRESRGTTGPCEYQIKLVNTAATELKLL